MFFKGVEPLACKGYGNTSLLGLLCFTSFCLAILNTKDQALGNKCNNNPPPPRFVALIEPYLSCDGNALQPVAPAHCWLATHRSVWLGGLSVASSGMRSKWFKNVTAACIAINARVAR